MTTHSPPVLETPGRIEGASQPEPSGLGRGMTVGMMAFGLFMGILAAVWVGAPGYLDADTYFATARVLHTGGGLQVPFVWNFLAQDFLHLPQPAHLYWMPLTTFLSAASMAVFGDSFNAGRLPFVLITAGLPLLTAWLATWLGARRSLALLAGGLAGFSGFYLPFFVTTDSFSVFALIGTLTLISIAQAPDRPVRAWLVAGVLTGLAHLARADGLLMLVVALGAWWLSDRRRRAGLPLLLTGYLLVMLGWFVRMALVAGGPLSPGGLKAAWLISYNALFAYPSTSLTFSNWLASGVGAIAHARLQALGDNLISLALVNGLVYLWPLVILAGWRLRKQPLVRLAAAYTLLLLAAMSLVFPFPGTRGGFFHSSAAVLPVLWALAPIGLDIFVGWMGGRRGWQPAAALRVLGAGTALIAALVTFDLLAVRQIIPAQAGKGWGATERDYASLTWSMADLKGQSTIVAVNNPPGFWLATGHPAVVIPDGGPDALQAVVQRFEATWVVLEANHPPGLDGLYQTPDSIPWLKLRARQADSFGQPMYIFRVTQPEASPP